MFCPLGLQSKNNAGLKVRADKVYGVGGVWQHRDKDFTRLLSVDCSQSLWSRAPCRV